jgi:hypothetical protein
VKAASPQRKDDLYRVPTFKGINEDDEFNL